MILAVSFVYEHHSLHLKSCNLETQSKPGKVLHVTWEVNKLRQIKFLILTDAWPAHFCLETVTEIVMMSETACNTYQLY